jgi:ATP-dependent DNA helicase RecG
MDQGEEVERDRLLKKLKVYTLLDLALNIPISYNDTTLSKSIEIGKIHTLQAEVEEARSSNGRLIVLFYLPQFDDRLQSIFFRVTPYHYQIFVKGSMHNIQGKIELYRGTLQMNQPKSIKNIGQILPKYKSPLKQSEIRTLIERYITQKSLADAGLLPREIDIVLSLHFPDNMEQIYDGSSLKQEIVDLLKYIEALNHISKLSKKRVDYPTMKALNGDISEFINSLPFRLTTEQSRVIEDIRRDLSSKDRAAKRVIVGDVGSGKTMVILASVMMALPNISILMAPTSLLAIQLYEEAINYLPQEVSISLVIQNREEGEYREAQFIIGTHALLYKDDLPKAPLVMIDEQHRFGTNQRQQLELISSDIGDNGNEVRSHFLQFSATPIPRTQAMMNSALVDVSLITKRPFKKSISTQVIGKEEFPRLLSHIKEEISKEHQVLIIYPLVEESKTIDYQSLMDSRGFWEKRFDNVYVTHGKDRDKEAVLLEFRERGDILLATTVVEVGISLPKLTLIVIVGAERLGLATLHQLRGRVGRLGLESWCYLFTKSNESSRLKAFAQTDSGFDIAKLDLKFRDSGDILDGTMQSGQKFKWLDMAEDEDIIAKAIERVD